VGERKGRDYGRRTSEEFYAAVEALDPSQRETVGRLMQHGNQYAAHPWWGSGHAPSMSWYYDVGGQKLALFLVFLRTGGVIVTPSIGGLYSAPASGKAKALQRLKGLRAIPEVAPFLEQVTEESLNRYPSIPVRGALDQPGVVERFLGGLDVVRNGRVGLACLLARSAIAPV
jgi:hypothetical protein